ncbi:molybdate ABC transporter ATP-binding protein ModF [Desulfosarcina widdelii]|uniref:Molybdate ABC transporter ATP-binding protein ModF n=1 Tax=Desulfosarcina widdelii TaxID=947919 RepID=A0A5K7YY77_9BACT|nr:ATP-binding cassette domain-containing protein [Desulfosarcina widdelii]BBO74326.1 molybdate ABC transporter ATP-binding protein ModF [Desulfosarcina widdelii]
MHANCPDNQKNRTLITVDAISVRLRDRWLFDGLSWRIEAGDQWVIAGPNGAGKTTLAKAIAGRLPVVRGNIHYHHLDGAAPTEAIAYVASDARRALWLRERSLDHARGFAGRYHDATTVGQWLDLKRPRDCGAGRTRQDLTDIHGILRLQALLDKPLMAVSTGEMSRILLARELIRRPKMLILDEPFEGLDASGRRELTAMLDRLAVSGLPMVLVVHRPEERLAATTHMLTLDDGRIAASGPMVNLADDFLRSKTASPPPKKRPKPISLPKIGQSPSNPGDEPLIDMRSVTVRYGETVILERLTWTVRKGEHWAITGPNGAGKSTLLKLITGDCLQVYANTIRLFGESRGAEQTLGEIRRRLGVVSHDLASGYQKRMPAMEVVCSGFFDSVGLYRRCDAVQRTVAADWLERLGLSSLSQTPFDQLSQGQRQMILIARAMVKPPQLLILDEPCSGLDPKNREKVLERVAGIGVGGDTGLLFVTHHETEIPACITHRLTLDGGRVVACGKVKGSRDEG